MQNRAGAAASSGDPWLTVPLGPKGAYWKAAAYFGLFAGVGAFAAGLVAFDAVAGRTGPDGTLFGFGFVGVVFGIPAIALAPRFLSARKGGALEVAPDGVRLVLGSRKDQRIRWDDMTEVAYGLKRVPIGKTAGVAEAVLIRSQKELLPIEVDEITYKVDHDRFVEAITLIADTARKHDAAVTPMGVDKW